MRVTPKRVKIHAEAITAVHLSAKTNYKTLLVGVEKNVAPSMDHEFEPESVNSSNGLSKQWSHIKSMFQLFKKN